MNNNRKKTKEFEIVFNGKRFEVPPGGSLGILALGAVGVRAWKKAKKQYEDQLRDGKEK